MADQLKLHKSLTEQVGLLESRGLTINDKHEAEQVLEKINYYRISGYLHSFRERGTDNYVPGVSFSEIIRIYEFDTKLTRLLMFVLEDIEETLKTRFSYELSSAYPNNPEIYLDKTIYKNENELNKFKKLFETAKKNNKELPFVKHHHDKYDGRLPMWVAVEIFTMGNLHALYNNLLTTHQKGIARKYNTGPRQLKDWIENLTYTRNHLAHYMRIFRYSFGRIPASCKNHTIKAVYRGKIFDQIAIMSFMYSKPQEWNSYVIPEIKELLETYKDVVKLEDLGFQKDWGRALIR